jgi:hypothetical protein
MPFLLNGEATPTDGFPVHEKAPSKPHPNNNPPKGGGFRPPILVKSRIQLTNRQTLILQFLGSSSQQYYFLS